MQGGGSPWVWVMPESVTVEVEGGVTFLRAEKTWLAVRPINLAEPFRVDAELTERVTRPAGEQKGNAWPGYQVLSARGKGGGFCGFALEVGESGDYAAFKKAVVDKSTADLSKLHEGFAAYTGSDGRSVALRFTADVSKSEVLKDARPHDWAAHAGLLFGGDGSPIRHEWLGGTLTVEAGGAAFVCTVDEAGRVEFTNR